jgi:periplasmic copper chaperone A
VVAQPVVAAAHVTVQPGEVEGGGFSVVSSGIPNEGADANATRLQVLLPADQPLGSARPTPILGWTVATKNRTLAKPSTMFGSRISIVVSEVTWNATGRGLPTGQFQDFDLSLGGLPEAGKLVFKAVQIYSSGEKVLWNQVPTAASAEPEHPAPILTLMAPVDDAGSKVPSETATGNSSPKGSAESDTLIPVSSRVESNSYPVLPLVLSGAPLVVSVAGVTLAWRRTRPTHRCEAAAAVQRVLRMCRCPRQESNLWPTA